MSGAFILAVAIAKVSVQLLILDLRFPATQGHHVTATSRTSYVKQAAEIGVTFYEDAHDFCEHHPDVVIFSTSIISFEQVLKSFPTQRLRRSTLVVDVASVKARILFD